MIEARRESGRAMRPKILSDGPARAFRRCRRFGGDAEVREPGLRAWWLRSTRNRASDRTIGASLPTRSGRRATLVIVWGWPRGAQALQMQQTHHCMGDGQHQETRFDAQVLADHAARHRADDAAAGRCQ